MQRYSEYHLTPDKELNILIYRTPSYVIIYRSYTGTLKMVRFLAHPVHVQSKVFWLPDGLLTTAAVTFYFADLSAFYCLW